MQSPLRPTVHGKPPRQLAISLGRPVLNGISANDRGIVVLHLANLLMEAAGVDPKESGDDER
jgi:hypothetical protein